MVSPLAVRNIQGFKSKRSLNGVKSVIIDNGIMFLMSHRIIFNVFCDMLFGSSCVVLSIKFTLRNIRDKLYEVQLIAIFFNKENISILSKYLNVIITITQQLLCDKEFL